MAGVREITISGIKKRLLSRYGEFINMDNVGGSEESKEVVKVSRAIAALAINVLNPEISEDVCSDSVCDGSDDRCIDAVYVNHDKKQVTIVQSKFDQSGNGSISRQDMADYLTSCRDVLMEEYNLFNERFKRSSESLEIAYDNSYKYFFVFAYSGRDELSEDVQRQIIQRKEEFNFDLDGDYIDIQTLALSKIKDYLSRRSLGNIDISDVEIFQYGVTEEPLKAVHGLITGDQVASWWATYGDLLLEDNIRGGLGELSDVNQGIKKTLIDSPEMFYYFNNGVTILVNSITPKMRNGKARRESGGFDLVNVNVINGAQTISTIGKAYLANEVTLDQLAEVKLPCRFIKVEDYGNEDGRGLDIALSITIANNSQNKVTARDFISKDPFQIELKRSFSFEEPYVYEIKRSEQDSIKSPSVNIITIEDALSALVCNLNSPRYMALLKSNRGRFFESITSPLYKAVFNPSVHCVMLINTVNIYRSANEVLSSMEKNRKTKRDEKIVIHGKYIFISLVMNKYRKLIEKNSVIHNDSIPDLKPFIFETFKKIKSHIDDNYATSHMPRFFENQGKVKEVMSL
ncbi:AIPR family protein [Enterobacter hormaechei]|uniref:AIPR family protein n=1 Tax=Enterobacter hormaechei TaxID=158836 RepID=UPI00197EDE3D|nr:AIPR family protein [Enterobacter hormaechei]MBN4787713.1 AIPR family protein [Enterobacter hormaechei]